MAAAQCDVLVIGAGAAGLMAAATAAGRGRRVQVLDHARKPGRKLLISGGGRCNFTHLHSGPEHFVSANPRFCISALRRYPPAAFLDWVQRSGIPYTEAAPGQLFCRDSSRPLLEMLLDACRSAGVRLRMQEPVMAVRCTEQGVEVDTRKERIGAEALIVATGGLAYPGTGATGLGYRIAEQLGLGVQPTRPALVPLTLPEPLHGALSPLSGITCRARITCRGAGFEDELLLAHHGLSGPAALQASLYWREAEPVAIDWLPGRDAAEVLGEARRRHPRRGLQRVLDQHLPRRLARTLCRLEGWSGPMQGYSDAALQAAAERLSAWSLTPAGTAGYGRAEVTAGGVDVDGLSSKTMEARHAPGVLFVGEVVDVTGELGGHNLQWAWSSGVAAGQAV